MLMENNNSRIIVLALVSIGFLFVTTHFSSSGKDYLEMKTPRKDMVEGHNVMHKQETIGV